MDTIECEYLAALRRAMVACDDALALALYNELQDYRVSFKNRVVERKLV